jgi:group I intron endonuclease
MKKQYVVYKSTNKINGDFYIGVSSQGLKSRKIGHLFDAKKGSDIRFHRAIRKYGEENFDWEVVLSVSSKEEMFQNEIKLISELNPQYNCTSGGDGQYCHTDETKKKISDKKRGKKPTESTMAGLRKFLSERTDKHLVLPLGPKSQQKKVICLNDNKVFDCAKDAAEFYSVDRSELGRNCRNEIKVLDGKIFKYFGDHTAIDDYQIQFMLLQYFEENLFKTTKFTHPRPVVCENDQILFGTAKECSKHYKISHATVVNRSLNRFKSKTDLNFSYLDQWCVNSL